MTESSLRNMQYLKQYIKNRTYYPGMGTVDKRCVRLRAKNYKVLDDELYFSSGPKFKDKSGEDEANGKNTSQWRKVPTSFEAMQEAICSVHIDKSGNHRNLEQTYKEALDYFYWVGIHRTIQAYIEKCACFTLKPDDGNSIGEFSLEEELLAKYEDPPLHLWHKVEMGILGPFTMKGGAKGYVILAVDVYSQWTEADVLMKVSVPGVMHFLLKLICRYGVMKTLYWKRENTIFGAIQEQLSELTGSTSVIKYVNTSRGDLADMWRNLTNLLDQFVSTYPDDWSRCIDLFLLPLRISRPEHGEYTPTYLAYRRESFLPDLVGEPDNLKEDVCLSTKEMSSCMDKMMTCYHTYSRNSKSTRTQINGYAKDASEKEELSVIDRTPSTVIKRRASEMLDNEVDDAMDNDIDSDPKAELVDSSLTEAQDFIGAVSPDQPCISKPVTPTRRSTRVRKRTGKLLDSVEVGQSKHKEECATTRAKKPKSVVEASTLNEEECGTPNEKKRKFAARTPTINDVDSCVTPKAKKGKNAVKTPTINGVEDVTPKAEKCKGAVKTANVNEVECVAPKAKKCKSAVKTPTLNEVEGVASKATKCKSVVETSTPIMISSKSVADGEDEDFHLFWDDDSDPNSIEENKAGSSKKRTKKAEMPNSSKGSQNAKLDQYYTDLNNYIVSMTYPPKCNEDYKRVIRIMSPLFKVHNGKLYNTSNRLIIFGEIERFNHLRDAHIDDEGNHFNRLKTVARLRDVFWKGMTIDCQAFVRACPDCAHGQTKSKTEYQIDKNYTDMFVKTETSTKKLDDLDMDEKYPLRGIENYFQTNSFPAPCTQEQKDDIINFLSLFALVDGALFYIDPALPSISRKVLMDDAEILASIKKAHIGPTGRHGRVQATYKNLTKIFYWNNMKKSVTAYIDDCCKKVNTSAQILSLQSRVEKFSTIFNDQGSADADPDVACDTLDKLKTNTVEDATISIDHKDSPPTLSMEEGSASDTPAALEIDMSRETAADILQKLSIGLEPAPENSDINHHDSLKKEGPDVDNSDSENEDECPNLTLSDQDSSDEEAMMKLEDVETSMDVTDISGHADNTVTTVTVSPTSGSCDKPKLLISEEKKKIIDFECSICKITIGGVKTYKEHMNSLHPGVKPFECNICMKRYTEYKYVHLHQRMHTGYLPFLCNICGKSFNREGTLKTHIKSHATTVQNKCPDCPRIYNSKSRLTMHIQKKHQSTEIFMCSLCKKLFTTRRSLKRHLMAHEGIKKFVCGACGKSFLRREYLNHHVKLHRDLSDEERKKITRKLVDKAGTSLEDVIRAATESISVNPNQGNPITVTGGTEGIDYQSEEQVITLSEKGSTLVWFGQQGVHYEIECEGNAELTAADLSAINILAQATINTETIETEGEQSFIVTKS